MNIIPKQLVEYDIIESRLLTVRDSVAVVLTPLQRSYFGNNTKLLGKRIVAIDMITLSSTTVYNGQSILAAGLYPQFTITLVDYDRKEIVKDYPIAFFGSRQNAGKLRIYNLQRIDLEASYVTPVDTTGLAAIPAITLWFNFFTLRN